MVRGPSIFPDSEQWEYAKALALIDRRSTDLGRALKIADLSGGCLAFSAYLATKGHDVEIFDMTHFWDHRKDFREEHRFQEWAAKHNLKFKYGSVFNIPAKTGAYDVVLSVSALEHVPHKRYALQEALRLLAPDGTLFFSFNLGTTITEDKTADAALAGVISPRRFAATLRALGIAKFDLSFEQISKA